MTTLAIRPRLSVCKWCGRSLSRPGPSSRLPRQAKATVLNPDYRDMLSAFADAEVEYMVIGAYAMAAHGHPRATGDIDLWVGTSPANAERVLEALSTFGAPLTEVDRDDFQTPDTVFQIGVSPRRIDVLTSIEGVDFKEAWPARLEIEIEGLTIPVISRRHLIENKRVLGRSQDLADIERLSEEDS
jgi:hypothetical protein